MAELQAWALPALAEQLGGNQKHEPLFRSFPQGIPGNTTELWWRKVLVHFLQAPDQPCLTCGRSGTTHVLSPCRHVICDLCFDGAAYSACPVCGCRVDRSSPFFVATAPKAIPEERVRFKLLDLSEDLRADAIGLFRALCARTQAMSPDDRQALTSIVAELGLECLEHLPDAIPVRENSAAIFGTLLTGCPPERVLPVAKRFVTTATDVLRLIAVHSGTDGSLLAETIFKTVEQVRHPGRFWGKIAELLGVAVEMRRHVSVPLRVHRFKVAKLSRAVRRSLLALLDGMPAEQLCEDMLRHRSYWVWIGEFLHPHEYASRFPTVARAFQLVRGKAPDGTPAPEFDTWAAVIERHIGAGDIGALSAALLERPGEFARRLDHLLRLAARDPQACELVARGFEQRIGRFATPVLATLRNHLPTRAARAPLRVFWPKVAVGRGVFAEDARSVLPGETIRRLVQAIDQELLVRFARKPHLAEAVLDTALAQVILPFNERTASPAAVNLPRGSTIPIETGKVMRLFLHWCQPEGGVRWCDLDLSVAFYDDQWRYVGVCSYYQLEARTVSGQVLARSAGDLTFAPWPDGASEFVDIHGDAAAMAGVRYVVAVVNNYNGLPFAQLARGFVGLMLRDDSGGQHFDPRTVRLRFGLQGENGVFMPLVVDLATQRLHWLDVYARGGLAMNNVENSKTAIRTICPGLIGYFASGIRPSLLEIGLLHAAARCQRVTLRDGADCRVFTRRDGESEVDFHARLVAGRDSDSRSPVVPESPCIALLYRGDLSLPAGSSAYALFRETTESTLEASDLLA